MKSGLLGQPGTVLRSRRLFLGGTKNVLCRWAAAEWGGGKKFPGCLAPQEWVKVGSSAEFYRKQANKTLRVFAEGRLVVGLVDSVDGGSHQKLAYILDADIE